MTRINSILIVLLFASSVLGQELKSVRETNLEFKILSVNRVDRDDHGQKKSDNIGIDTKVRVRLVNRGPEATYIFTNWKDGVIPSGYTLEIGSKTRWFDGLQSSTTSSPGLKYLNQLTDGGRWMRFDAGTAVEWYVFDSTHRGFGNHAISIFIKSDPSTKSAIWEVLSESYELPKVE